MPRDNDDREKMTAYWESEIKALKKMNKLNNNHIVRFVAAFRRCHKDGRDHYLMFEWADGGNLRSLWETFPRSSISASLVKDSCRQLLGLASALAVAHNLSDSSSYRHGDLKPANILRFNNGTEIGLLKIGDWGEAKEHNSVTELRFDKTSAAYGTLRYEAPEVEVGLNARVSKNGNLDAAYG